VIVSDHAYQIPFEHGRDSRIPVYLQLLGQSLYDTKLFQQLCLRTGGFLGA